MKKFILPLLGALAMLTITTFGCGTSGKSKDDVQKLTPFQHERTTEPTPPDDGVNDDGFFIGSPDGGNLKPLPKKPHIRHGHGPHVGGRK